jgi:HK97 family phage portal protein
VKKLGFLQRVRTAWGSLRADGGMGVQLSPFDDALYASRGYQTATGLRVSPESAMRVAAVFACVRVVAETVASLPLIIYRRKDDGGKERAVDHPLYSILHESPNQWQTAYEFLEMMQAHLELRGNAYALIVAGNGNAIDSLVPLHPDRVLVKRQSNGRLQYSVRDFYGGNIKTYLQEEMLHLRGLSADGLVGMSTIAVGAEAVANALASQEYSSRFFENDATPPVAFVHQKTLSADAYTRLKTGLQEAHGGANHHKPIILEEGMDVKTLGIKPIDSQLLEARQASRGDIASMFRVPPHKMGDLTRATFSNIEQQNIEFATDCIRPRLVRLEKRIQKDLITALNFGNGEQYFCEFLMEALMRGDQQSRYRSYAIGRQWGWLSANDVCRFESLNPIGPGGDEYMRPLNMENATQANPDQIDEGISQQDSTGEGSGTGAKRLQEFVRAAAERVVRKEVKALRKVEGRESSGDFAREVREFYATHGQYVAESMRIELEDAERYARTNRDLVLMSVNAIDDIEANAAAVLVDLATPAVEHASKQLGQGVTVHVEPHIHMAQPQVAIQPIEVKVSNEATPKPIRSVRVERRKDGKFDFQIEDQEPQRKTGTVQRGRDGKVQVFVGGEDGA